MNDYARDDREEENDPLRRALADVFGFRSFRPYQEEIARAVLDGRDVFAVMPTGGGKSLCYQLPAILRPGVCVVISPLLSLMKDQVDSAQKNGISAATLNSTTSLEEWRVVMQELDRGRLDLLYVSPERFRTDKFIELLHNVETGFFAVDEAHCISQWGHNFREDYLALGLIADEFPDAPIAAFTATATELVGDDVKRILKLRDPFCVKASFDRPNLFYQIAQKDDLNAQLNEFLREFRDESGVVYRSTRKSVEQTADNLRKMGFNAAAYHAGMTDEERARIQDAFANDEIPIIVATIAFGMGIDKSNVRFVVHGDLPRDIESYYQETGRAGRDGAPARCLLLYSWQDVALQRRFLQDYEDPRARAAASARLEEMIRFVEADGCRRANLLRYFGEEYKPPETALDDEEDARDRSAVRSCGACDFCVGDCARIDATIDAQKALSAMQRTGNRFGASHVVDVLLGKETERIKNLGHDRLPTFGVGANRTRRFWKRLIQSMLAQGVAVLAPSELPIPQVSDAGWDVMRGKRKFEILDRPENDEKKERRTRERRSNALDDKASLDVDDRRLFEALRAKRREIAMKEGTPPYVVFTDKTLVDMTRLKPQTDDDFLLVQGVGRAKLRAYGRTFMTVVRKFLEENGGGDE